jgi:two-component system, NarL family, response regulator DevR
LSFCIPNVGNVLQGNSPYEETEKLSWIPARRASLALPGSPSATQDSQFLNRADSTLCPHCGRFALGPAGRRGTFETAVDEATALNAKIKVFLLAGCRLYREALARLLASKRDLCIVGCASSFAEAAGVLGTSGCEILLVNPANGESYDFSLLESIARATPGTKKILIDMVEDEGVFLRAVCSGAQGYLLKEASAMNVIDAVRSVYRGEVVCPPRLCLTLFRQFASNHNGHATMRPKTGRLLTRREQQVVPLIGRGLTNKEIAVQLNVSERTVKSHVHRILKRVGATDRLSAFEIARDRRLLSLFMTPSHEVPLGPQPVSR